MKNDNTVLKRAFSKLRFCELFIQTSTWYIDTPKYVGGRGSGVYVLAPIAPMAAWSLLIKNIAPYT